MTQPAEQVTAPESINPIPSKTYVALALDPIHVGTGGYRLGRVDNSIVREPGTNLPKIPGTSLSGVCRANAAMATGRYAWSVKKIRKDHSETDIPGSCAGQGQSREERDQNPGKAGHCGSPYCPVCVTFGFARGDQGGFQGLAQFSDARILFFPVHSMIGPVWLTCPSVLAEQDVSASLPLDNTVKLSKQLSVASNRLNLGWLMLPAEAGFALPEDRLTDMPAQIRERVVLVSDKLFSRIVNDNLEVRTSVSINPATGAAEEGALFTYEAMPKATVLWFSVTYNDPKFFRIKWKNGQNKDEWQVPDPRKGASVDGQSMSVQDVVEQGLSLCEHLGIGGMNTRGMGRIQVLNLNKTGGQKQ